MTAADKGKRQPVEPNTDALDRAVADVQTVAANLREMVAQADAVTARLAALLGTAGLLMGLIAQYQQAQRAVLNIDDLLALAAETAPKEAEPA